MIYYVQRSITLLQNKNKRSDKMTEYVEFEIVSTENSQITLKGYVDITTIDDDEPEIGYYDHQGFTTTNLPKNPFDFAEKEHMQYYNLIQKWAEDSQFLQWIWDCKDDNRREIDRGNYYLIIN